MNLNYLVYHNILATVVASYWDDGYNLVTLGLENYFLDINTVVTRYMKYQGGTCTTATRTWTSCLACYCYLFMHPGYCVIYIALMPPILPEAACLGQHSRWRVRVTMVTNATVTHCSVITHTLHLKGSYFHFGVDKIILVMFALTCYLHSYFVDNFTVVVTELDKYWVTNINLVTPYLFIPRGEMLLRIILHLSIL